MRIWNNLKQMNDKAYLLTKRGLQLTVLFLAMGCWALTKGELFIADQFRQLSTLALLFTVIIPPYIESKQ